MKIQYEKKKKTGKMETVVQRSHLVSDSPNVTCTKSNSSAWCIELQNAASVSSNNVHTQKRGNRYFVEMK